MKQISLKKNIILSTAYQILLLITPLITTPYISRVLGPEGNGIYSYTNSYQVYFSMFAALGTVSYGEREIAMHRNDGKTFSKLFWEIELLTVFTSSICLIAWFIFIGFQQNNRIYYLILTLNLINTMLDISWFYSGLEQFKYTVSKNAVCKILGVIAQLTLVRNSNDVAIYILILCLTTLLGTISMWFSLPKFLVKVERHDLHVFRHLKQTFAYFIPTVATTIYTVLDKTLIGLITKSSEENGYYEQATKIINMMKALTFSAVNAVLGSRISYLFAQQKFDEIKKHIRLSLDYIFFLGFGMCFGVIGIAPVLVPIFFGKNYLPVIPLLYIFSPIVIIIGISNCLGSQYYTPFGYRKQSAIYIIAGAVINLLLNLLMIPQWQANGAAIASVIAETIITILYMHYCQGFLRMIDLWHIGWKKLIAGLMMGIIVHWLGTVIPTGLLCLFIQIIMGTIIYLILLIILHDSFIYELKNIVLRKK